MIASSLGGVASLGGGTASAAAAQYGAPGYWLVASDGGVYQFGTASFGSLRGDHLQRPIVGSAVTSNGRGYWLVASDGGVFSFGNAGFAGSTGGVHLKQPIVGMAADPATGGYWLVAADGGVFSFRAPFYGSTGGVRLAKPIVAMAPTADGKGYWLVASDGGVFAFGNAGFHGSTGGVHLARPVVGMATTPSGKGYWMVASDGGIFAFGDAGFDGSTGGIALKKPVVGMASTPDGRGYWLVASDGGLFTFGDAPFYGSAAGRATTYPIVTMMATAHGYPFPPGATGYDISQYQCNDIPPNHVQVSVVQASGGSITTANSCYKAEASWAGPNMAAYIFVDGLPSPAPPESLGSCGGNASCESYNFGWYWARHWVAYSRGLGFYPNLWFLDVETDGDWNTSAAFQPANARLIAGAVAGLRSTGVLAGIYSTAYQWKMITGDQASFPGIPLWVPGAGNIDSGTYDAVSFCSDPGWPYAPLAGGSVVLVQYGYPGNGYDGPRSPYDQDYACK